MWLGGRKARVVSNGTQASDEITRIVMRRGPDSMRFEGLIRADTVRKMDVQRQRVSSSEGGQRFGNRFLDMSFFNFRFRVRLGCRRGGLCNRGFSSLRLLLRSALETTNDPTRKKQLNSIPDSAYLMTELEAGQMRDCFVLECLNEIGFCQWFAF